MPLRSAPLLAMLLCTNANAASPCDQRLPQSSSHQLGYQLRGQRCEGIYHQPVSGSFLAVTSFTSAFEDFGKASPKGLTVRWTAPPNSAARLRAYSLRPKLYYQMDAELPASATVFHWPSDVLRPLDMKRSDLGVVAFTNHRVADAERVVYLPVSIGKSQSKQYELVLVPNAELKSVAYSLARAASGRGAPAYLIRDRDHGKLYYPAQRPIVVRLPKPEADGIYLVEVGGVLRDGGVTAQQVWFYHRSGLD